MTGSQGGLTREKVVTDLIARSWPAALPHILERLNKDFEGLFTARKIQLHWERNYPDKIPS